MKRSLKVSCLIAMIILLPILACAQTRTIFFDEERPIWNGSEITWEKSVLTLREAGTYEISGTCNDGSIVVDVGKKDTVTLILAGLDLASSARTLEVLRAREVILVLQDGTENRIVSRSPEESAVYSKADLLLSGNGTLKIASTGKHGIRTSDGFTMMEGTLSVEAAGHAVRAQDVIRIQGGTLELTSSGDGLHTTGDADKIGSGTIRITGGRLRIQSGEDGIQSAADLTVTGGSLEILTGSGSANGAHHEEAWGRGWRQETAEEPEQTSRKGLKCRGTLRIRGGEIRVDAEDDGLHSDGDIEISGGTLIIASGDDGIHADRGLSVSGGSVSVTRAYEGMEGNRILLAGGSISVMSEDDGINAWGGDNPWGWRRESAKRSENMPELRIQGGDIYINAEGDGLDSNGNLFVEGGHIVVDGPSRSWNGALDSGSESGGRLMIQGGTVLAIGASGMAEVFEETSQQCSFCYNGLEFREGDMISIQKEDGYSLIEHTAAKSGNSVVFSSPELSVGMRLCLTVGQQSEWILLENVTTSFGESGWRHRW